MNLKDNYPEGSSSPPPPSQLPLCSKCKQPTLGYVRFIDEAGKPHAAEAMCPDCFQKMQSDLGMERRKDNTPKP